MIPSWTTPYHGLKVKNSIKNQKPLDGAGHLGHQLHVSRWQGMVLLPDCFVEAQLDLSISID